MNSTRTVIRPATVAVVVASLAFLGATTAQAKPGPAPALLAPSATVAQHHEHHVHHVQAVDQFARPDSRPEPLRNLDRAPRFRFDAFPS